MPSIQTIDMNASLESTEKVKEIIKQLNLTGLNIGNIRDWPCIWVSDEESLNSLKAMCILFNVTLTQKDSPGDMAVYWID